MTEYLPFGELLVDEHRNSHNTRYKFNGKEFDQETGNYYYGARYYDPKTSLWLSVDPLAEKYNEWSPYNYTLNNPVKYVDPDGREIVYHDNNSLLFNIGFKLRLTFLKVFGKREIRKKY